MLLFLFFSFSFLFLHKKSSFLLFSSLGKSNRGYQDKRIKWKERITLEIQNKAWNKKKAVEVAVALVKQFFKQEKHTRKRRTS